MSCPDAAGLYLISITFSRRSEGDRYESAIQQAARETDVLVLGVGISLISSGRLWRHRKKRFGRLVYG